MTTFVHFVCVCVCVYALAIRSDDGINCRRRIQGDGCNLEGSLLSMHQFFPTSVNNRPTAASLKHRQSLHSHDTSTPHLFLFLSFLLRHFTTFILVFLNKNNKFKRKTVLKINNEKVHPTAPSSGSHPLFNLSTKRLRRTTRRDESLSLALPPVVLLLLRLLPLKC